MIASFIITVVCTIIGAIAGSSFTYLFLKNSPDKKEKPHNVIDVMFKK